MAVHSIVAAAKLLLVLLAIVGFPNAMVELHTLCSVSRSSRRASADSYGTHLKVLVGVLLVVVLLFFVEPEYRAVLFVIDAIGIDMFLMLLAIQFYFYAFATRAALAVPLAHLLKSIRSLPCVWPAMAQWRHSPSGAVQLTGLQFGLFGLWALDRMRVLGLTVRWSGP